MSWKSRCRNQYFRVNIVFEFGLKYLYKYIKCLAWSLAERREIAVTEVKNTA